MQNLKTARWQLIKVVKLCPTFGKFSNTGGQRSDRVERIGRRRLQTQSRLFDPRPQTPKLPRAAAKRKKAEVQTAGSGNVNGKWRHVWQVNFEAK